MCCNLSVTAADDAVKGWPLTGNSHGILWTSITWGIIRVFYATSGENCNERHSVNRCSFRSAKMLWTMFASVAHWGSLQCCCCIRLPLLQLLFVVITYWRHKFMPLENLGNFFSYFVVTLNYEQCVDDSQHLKPKFHYADFHRNFPAGKVTDANDESRGRKPSWRVCVTLV